MTECTTNDCGNPTSEYLCTRCVEDLQAWLEKIPSLVQELVLQRDEARRGRAAAWDVGYAAAILDMGQSDEPPSINPWHEEAIA